MKRSVLFIALIFVFCRMGCNCEDETGVTFLVENKLNTDIELTLEGYRISGDRGESVQGSYTIKPGEAAFIHRYFPGSSNHHVEEGTILFFDTMTITNEGLTAIKNFKILSEWDKNYSEYTLFIGEEDF